MANAPPAIVALVMVSSPAWGGAAMYFTSQSKSMEAAPPTRSRNAQFSVG